GTPNLRAATVNKGCVSISSVVRQSDQRGGHFKFRLNRIEWNVHSLIKNPHSAPQKPGGVDARYVPLPEMTSCFLKPLSSKKNGERTPIRLRLLHSVRSCMKYNDRNEQTDVDKRQW
ncbi:hypothetical protein AMELA_G00119780, partial [Ameiurus melas]